MDAPKCRVCGVVHWPREPHKFSTFAAEAIGAVVQSRMAVESEVLRRELAAPAVTHAIPVTHSVTHTDDAVTHIKVGYAETGAERAKRFRKAHAEEYRKANRERMKLKRQEKP